MARGGSIDATVPNGATGLSSELRANLAIINNMITVDDTLQNTYVGTGAASAITGGGGKGNESVYIGYNAGNAITHDSGNNEANNNVFIGHQAGLVSQAHDSVFIGQWAGKSDDVKESHNHVIIGARAGEYMAEANIGGTDYPPNENTLIGHNACNALVSGIDMTCVGAEAGLYANITATGNTGYCTYIGAYSGAGANGTNSGINNTAVGAKTMYVVTTGYDNCVMGREAAESLTTGYRNVIIGNVAADKLTTGYRNTCVGYASGYPSAGSNNLIDAQNCTFLGADTGFTTSTDYNYAMALGSEAKVNAANTCVIGGTGAGNYTKVAIFNATASGQLHVAQAISDAAIPVLYLQQVDQDEPFIYYAGQPAADQTKSISTINGDGAVEGPKNFSSSAGWAYEGMIRISLNGTDRWMPYYSEDTA